jgi:hypothetical protein
MDEEIKAVAKAAEEIAKLLPVRSGHFGTQTGVVAI